jgi:hypothetical protein
VDERSLRRHTPRGVRLRADARGGYSSLQTIEQSFARTQQLLGEAQQLAYDVNQIDQAFQRLYPQGYTGATSSQQLVSDAQERWQNSLAAHQDALRVQAGVVQNLDTTRSETDALVLSSQSAVGGLQATQAGNQLVALQTKQLVDLTALIAAQSRAQSLAGARTTVNQEQAREQLNRFLGGTQVLAALALLGLGIFGPGIATGLAAGAPQLGAGAAVGTALAAGGLGVAGAMGLRAGAGAVGRAARGAAALGGRAFGTGSTGMAGASAGANVASSTPAGGPPEWAQRMRRHQAMSHGISAAAHAVRSGDHGGGSTSVSLSEDRK